ncbi:transposase, partial [Roseomonas sp. DSM 102946]|nr:transposase [Roseomonas sp. DSM 102946]
MLSSPTLSDPAWAALAPHLPPLAPQGRRTASLRTRMEAIFHHAATPGAPWASLPSHYGRPDTVARFFRRLTHAGLWH